MQQPRQYAVTVYTTDDPDSIRTIIKGENEVIDTYPHWGGQREITSREGWLVTIHEQPANSYAQEPEA